MFELFCKFTMITHLFLCFILWSDGFYDLYMTSIEVHR
jgi:hypothetical protein